MIFRAIDYNVNGKWLANKTNCSDPKELFENIVSKREEFVNFTAGKYIDGKITYDNHWNPNDYWAYAYGRCFTLATPDEHKKLGMVWMRLKFFVKSTIYIHSRGMFVDLNGHEVLKFDVKVGYSYEYDIKQELHDTLANDYAGDICNNTSNYSKDLCTDKAIEKESLDTFGCTTPFGPDKSNICKDHDKGKKVIQNVYLEGYKWNTRSENYGNCSYPCSFFSFTSKKLDGYEVSSYKGKHSYVTLNFGRIIKVTKDIYAYTEQNLIADIGGYVGLFLGVSINQVTTLVKFLIGKSKQILKF